MRKLDLRTWRGLAMAHSRSNEIATSYKIEGLYKYEIWPMIYRKQFKLNFKSFVLMSVCLFVIVVFLNQKCSIIWKKYKKNLYITTKCFHWIGPFSDSVYKLIRPFVCVCLKSQSITIYKLQCPFVVCCGVSPPGNQRFSVDWRLLVREHIAIIG